MDEYETLQAELQHLFGEYLQRFRCIMAFQFALLFYQNQCSVLKLLQQSSINLGCKKVLKLFASIASLHA